MPFAWNGEPRIIIALAFTLLIWEHAEFTAFTKNKIFQLIILLIRWDGFSFCSNNLSEAVESRRLLSLFPFLNHFFHFCVRIFMLNFVWHLLQLRIFLWIWSTTTTKTKLCALHFIKLILFNVDAWQSSPTQMVN